MPKVAASEPLPFSSPLLIGVDEAGRRSLAGPVVVAAVTWSSACGLPVVDSKKLSAKQREVLFDAILAQADAVYITCRGPEEIDNLGILAATLQGMAECIQVLGKSADCPVVIEGHQFPVKPAPAHHFAVVKGDSRVPAVWAASILAKVTRDRLMAELDLQNPQYGFAKNQGYGTAQHLDALQRLGPCTEHRQTFGQVKSWQSTGRGPQFFYHNRY